MAQEARDWYAERSAVAAKGFLLALEEALDRVSASPDRYKTALAGCREHVFPNQFPFTLVYRVANGKVVEIVAVASQRRRPAYWSHR